MEALEEAIDADITCGDVPFCWCDGDSDISACGGDISLGIGTSETVDGVLVEGAQLLDGVGWCWLVGGWSASIGCCRGGRWAIVEGFLVIYLGQS